MQLLISDANILIDIEMGGLTGDRDLKAAAESENIEVRGTLWLVTEMVRSGRITVQIARNAYHRMHVGGRRCRGSWRNRCWARSMILETDEKEPTMRWMKLMLARSLAGCFVCAVAIQPAQAAKVGQRFPSVEAFVKSFPQGQAKIAPGYGNLAGAGRRDWAGVVLLEDAEVGPARQLVVLMQKVDGSYQVAAQSGVDSTEGGTGHHALDEVSVKQGSVYVSWSWNWQGCSGGSIQQIKFYKDQWRVIGAEFRQSSAIEAPNGYDPGDSATLSNNLLTGTAIIHFQPLKRKPETKTLKLTPAVIVLDDKFDEDAGGVDEFAKYAGC